MGRALKKQIITAVEPVFPSPMVDQLTGFGQVSALTMLQRLFSRCGVIEKIDLKEMQSRWWVHTTPRNPLPK